MIRTRMINGLLLLFVIVFYIFSDDYIALLLLVLTMTLYLLSLFLPLIVKNKIDITVDSNHSFYKSEKGTLYLHVSNRSLLPIPKLKCHVQVHNILVDEQFYKDVYIALNGKSTITVPLSLMSNYVGKVAIEVTHFSAYDFFGNFSLSKQIQKQSAIYVLPIPQSNNLSQEDMMSANSEFELNSSEEIGMNTYDVIGFKEYEEGDNLKQIHWKVSSKVDDLIVKEMSKPKEKSSFVLLEPALKETDSMEINRMVESLYSLSTSLLNNGQVHSIGWFDNETNHLKVHEIYSKEQLHYSLREILAISFKNTSSVSLDAFLQSEHFLETSHLFYIKSKQIATQSVEQLNHINVSTIHCSPEEEDNVQAYSAS